ncbi:hypothetical protein Nepgr_008460 [Nepenthes gracilis]|uniref:Trafficking protein particle complex subunit 11 domain-containing protein n=1 Tax=Nepenthes gracilis TaxID=150966 RepID=A0AAD3S8R6_NEPGR|nr:hypothetical protein Nepgr_008460 [Nepenthes gracilis]
MEEYPEELRTPPVGLISLVGCPELHQMISTHLHSEKPPVNTLALPDFSKISIMAKTPKDTGASGNTQPAGILKRDWLLKHRTKMPAVATALIPADHVSGDPAQWNQLCTHLDQLKAVISPRNIKLVVVVVQASSRDDFNEDRMIALRKRAEVDFKYIITFSLNVESDLKQSLNRLGILFAELINVYYRDEGHRIKTCIEKKTYNYVELCIRYCFKVAVYAEFRRDWVEALKFYEDSYHALREMIATSTRLPARQRLVEIKTLAEQLHFKISTLLLHGGKIIEAVLWFRQHCASYRKLIGAAEVNFLHWEWMSRQFLVFAELLETSSRTVPGFPSLISLAMDKSLTEWEFQPAYYYQLASHYLKEKRSCLDLSLSMLEASYEIDGSAESVMPSIYVGQFARLLEKSDGVISMQLLTDEEFIHYAVAEGKRFQDSFEIIALLKKAFDIYSSLKATRMASHCGFHMAKEYFYTGETSKAKESFESVVHLYRHEGWVTLLWEILGYLRECSRRDGSLKEFMEYSLEMAALPVSSNAGIHSFSHREFGPAGPPSFHQREVIHKEALGLVSRGPGFTSNGDGNNLHLAESSLHLEIDLVSPLRVALLASVAFHEQLVKPGIPTLITVSLMSQLPVAVEIDALEVQFNQSECNFTILNAQKSPSIATSVNQQGYCREEIVPSLALITNKWLRLTYDVKSDRSGKLECVSIIARIGSHFTICCRAESPASMGDVPLWKFEEHGESLPIKDPPLSLSGQKAIQVEEPDLLVDVNLAASGPALVGENFVVPVTIVSKGHAVDFGELKINLVDSRGGGLVSPREYESFSTESHHVELIGISEPDGDDKSQVGSGNIRKIQHSFGLVSVPYLDNGGSWSCRIEIKWHRPKPIMLFVSLGYSPCSDDANAQKIHVHKSLQIEGKTPIIVSHRTMLPFRCDPLLLSRIKLAAADSDRPAPLPLNEASILIVSAENCSEVPLRLISMSIEHDDASESSCTVCSANDDLVDSVGPALLMPGKEYRKVFSAVPIERSQKVKMGTVCLRWKRDSESHEQSYSSSPEILTRHRLPETDVELSPLVVCLECPPCAVLGDPFTYFVKIRNETELLQEIKFSLIDSYSFVSSGPHDDTTFVLPKSEHILSYKLVPLASGMQQLPRVVATAVRYSAGFEPSTSALTIFVFPSKPAFEMGKSENGSESVFLAAE